MKYLYKLFLLILALDQGVVIAGESDFYRLLNSSLRRERLAAVSIMEASEGAQATKYFKSIIGRYLQITATPVEMDKVLNALTEKLNTSEAVFISVNDWVIYLLQNPEELFPPFLDTVYKRSKKAKYIEHFQSLILSPRDSAGLVARAHALSVVIDSPSRNVAWTSVHDKFLETLEWSRTIPYESLKRLMGSPNPSSQDHHKKIYELMRNRSDQLLLASARGLSIALDTLEAADAQSSLLPSSSSSEFSLNLNRELKIRCLTFFGFTSNIAGFMRRNNEFMNKHADLYRRVVLQLTDTAVRLLKVIGSTSASAIKVQDWLNFAKTGSTLKVPKFSNPPQGCSRKFGQEDNS